MANQRQNTLGRVQQEYAEDYLIPRLMQDAKREFNRTFHQGVPHEQDTAEILRAKLFIKAIRKAEMALAEIDAEAIKAMATAGKLKAFDTLVKGAALLSAGFTNLKEMQMIDMSDEELEAQIAGIEAVDENQPKEH